MIPFFNSPARVEALRLAAERWIGTPFVLRSRVPGAGVDCVHFVAEVLVECRQLDRYEFPAYQVDGGSHLQESLVESWLGRNPLFTPQPITDLAAGDVLEFQIGRGVAHHVGIHSGDGRRTIWSAMNNDGVQARTLRDATWGRRLVRAWRPLATEVVV